MYAIRIKFKQAKPTWIAVKKTFEKLAFPFWKRLLIESQQPWTTIIVMRLKLRGRSSIEIIKLTMPKVDRKALRITLNKKCGLLWIESLS